MVSLEQRQAVVTHLGSDSHLKRLDMLLRGEPLAFDSSRSGVPEQILTSIANGDASSFKALAAQICARKASAQADWCQDDYLLFLLLLGKEKFSTNVTCLKEVINVRRQNPNPVPQKINEVFAALERREFGIDGELGFLKIPFLQLAGKLDIGPEEAQRALAALSQPNLLTDFPPFLRLLALRAHDLVLTHRRPIATETAKDLIEGFEQHGRNLSLTQWMRVAASLPGKIIWSVVCLIFGILVSPILFGFGREAYRNYQEHHARLHRPEEVQVSAVKIVGPELPAEVRAIAETLKSEAPQPPQIVIETTPFERAGPKFVIEVSHPSLSIKRALAFLERPASGTHPFTIVPVDTDGSRFRALLPAVSAGERVSFILQFAGDSKLNSELEGKRIILRPLD